MNQTAFYPTSGGQPHDTGHIHGIPVIDVWEDHHGKIWHSLEEVPHNHNIRGTIDWSRRFDHMQQHTGQHILSAVCSQLLGAKTIGFRIGSDVSTIDLDLQTFSDEMVKQIETNTNTIIWKNYPVKIRFITDDEARSLDFRKEPQTTGKIRVIEIDKIDLTGCGGTHVKATGEIGLIKIIRKERYKNGIRVGFICGGRALRNYQNIYKLLKEISAEFSTHPDQLPAYIKNLQAEKVNARHEIREIKKRYIALETEKIWREAPVFNNIHMIYGHVEERTFDDIKQLATTLREYPKTLSVLAVTEENQIRIICTRSFDLTSIDAAKVLKKVLENIGGRGGGSSDVAQGGIPYLESTAISDALSAVMNSLQHE